MKSTVSASLCETETPFPKLMISTETNLIVLMVTQGKGTVVGNPTKENQLGSFSTDWIKVFVDFTGSICLQNKE